MVTGKYNSLLFVPFLLSCLCLLTGCPGKGDRFRPNETTQVELISDSVCFNITDAQDYQPAIISINPRGTPSGKQMFVDGPSLSINSGQLCVPPSFYHFKNNEKYIVDFVLTSVKSVDESRRFIVGVGVHDGHLYNFPLTDREIARPYGSIEVSE